MMLISRIYRPVLMLILLAVGFTLNAQMKVVSFESSAFDLSASTSPRYDRNGNLCAMIRVTIPVEGCKFNGNVLDVVYDVNEYNVYMSGGTKYIRVKCPGVETLDIKFGDISDIECLEQGVTYVLKISGYRPGQPVQQPASGQSAQQPATPPAQAATARPTHNQSAQPAQNPQSPSASSSALEHDYNELYREGNKSFKNYDELAKNSRATLEDKSTSLLISYILMRKANEIGGKNDKDIAKIVSSHAQDFMNLAAENYNSRNYKPAYQLFGDYAEIVGTEPYRRMLNLHDSVAGNAYFNQALCAWQIDMLPEALDAFGNALNKGYIQKNIFDYAIAVATQAGDQEAILEWAEKADKIYGWKDSGYIAHIVNVYMKSDRYDKADQRIDMALKENPGNATPLYFYKGVVADAQKDWDTAISWYKKAFFGDSRNFSYLSSLGAAYCQKAFKLSDEKAGQYSGSEWTKYFNESLRPLFTEAADYLEEAHKIDSKNQEVIKYLENIYHNLGDTAKEQFYHRMVTN